MDTVTLNLGKRETVNTSRWLRSALNDKRLLTIVGCFFIATVSVHDTYLVTIEPQILIMEKNPICTSLILMDPDSLLYFIGGKMTGTLAVISAILFFHRIKYSGASLVTGAIVGFQAMLLIYLHLSDPLIGGLPNFALLFQSSPY